MGSRKHKIQATEITRRISLTLILFLTILSCSTDKKPTDAQEKALGTQPLIHQPDTVKGVVCGTALNEKAARSAKAFIDSIATDTMKQKKGSQ
jgi:hypothetical protein